MKNKSIIAVVAISSLFIFSFSGTSILSQAESEPAETTQSEQTEQSDTGKRVLRGGAGYGFVDSDKDGICDRWQNRSSRFGRGAKYGSEMGKGNGWRRRGFCGRGFGKGNRRNGQMRNRSGYFRNFTDNNGNGICDWRESQNNSNL